MKKIIFAFFVLAFYSTSFAQSDKYQAAMEKNLGMVTEAFKDPQKLLALSNTFERIGDAEKTQWLPYYYAALFQANYGLMQKDASGGDDIAAKATALIDKASALSPNNSEISCVRSMVSTVSLMVNPMQRYMEYGAQSSKYLDEAIQQDPANPRPYFLKAQTLMYTPASFGGGCDAATPVMKIALEKYAAFKPASNIAPNWGEERANELMKECGK